jgi:hypothetical protein
MTLLLRDLIAIEAAYGQTNYASPKPRITAAIRALKASSGALVSRTLEDELVGHQMLGG